MMHQNSLFTYNNRVRPELSRRQAEVFHIFSDGGEYTDEQVAAKLQLGINQITGRIGELIKKKRIEQVGTIELMGRKRRLCRKIL